jgi:hypothetical protein
VAELWTNNAESTLAGAITDVATTLDVQLGDAFKYPDPNPPDFFYCTLTNAAGTLIEIIKVTDRTGNTFSVIVRGQQGTTALAWNDGDKVELRLTKSGLEGLQASFARSFALMGV